MDKLKLQLLLKMSDMFLTKFVVISISSFILQKLYFHLTIISLLNSMEKTQSCCRLGHDLRQTWKFKGK